MRSWLKGSCVFLSIGNCGPGAMSKLTTAPFLSEEFWNKRSCSYVLALVNNSVGLKGLRITTVGRQPYGKPCQNALPSLPGFRRSQSRMDAILKSNVFSMSCRHASGTCRTKPSNSGAFFRVGDLQIAAATSDRRNHGTIVLEGSRTRGRDCCLARHPTLPDARKRLRSVPCSF